MKIEAIYIYATHKDKRYCLAGEQWFKSDDYDDLHPIHNDELISELKLSFQEIAETLQNCPACKSELSYKNGACRNGLCVMHYEEFMV